MHLFHEMDRQDLVRKSLYLGHLLLRKPLDIRSIRDPEWPARLGRPYSEVRSWPAYLATLLRRLRY